MSGATMFDRRMLEVAFSEIEVVRQSLPQATLTVLAQEVVHQVAINLGATLPPDLLPNSDDIDALCTALLSDKPDAAAVFIEAARRQGSSYESLCLFYLSVAAGRLGEWWDDDKVPFYRVTIAAGRIYAILRILRMDRPILLPDMRRAAVFASVPGENHTLGLAMATDLARDRGWDIDLFMGLTHDALVEQLLQRKPALICLSASGKRALPALTRLIVAVRISNPDARILICGQIASAGLGLIGITGADATAQDFQAAIDQMERLLNLTAGRPTGLS